MFMVQKQLVYRNLIFNVPRTVMFWSLGIPWMKFLCIEKDASLLYVCERGKSLMFRNVGFKLLQNCWSCSVYGF